MVLYSILFYSILFYSILFYSILFCSILFCSVLFWSTLCYAMLCYALLYLNAESCHVETRIHYEECVEVNYSCTVNKVYCLVPVLFWRWKERYHSNKGSNSRLGSAYLALRDVLAAVEDVLDDGPEVFPFRDDELVLERLADQLDVRHHAPAHTSSN